MEVNYEIFLNSLNRNILYEIDNPDDLKKLKLEEIEKLSFDIREFLIEKVSKSGGHLAPNLGVVELTLALHSVFDTRSDKIIWDVGHQSYVHKILTGRKGRFDTLRQFEGLCGFPKVKESEHDCFNTGHSSTSISAALGFAKARELNNQNYSVVAVIGDGAMTGGMAYEALNDAGRHPNNLIVVLNDNEMSISKNVGGMSKYLTKIRTGSFYNKIKEDIDVILKRFPSIANSAFKAIEAVKGSIKQLVLPGMLFEELGFKYLGPVDGHNYSEIVESLNWAKSIKGPVLLHVVTQKGKGYHHAEVKPSKFHGISPFEIETGEVVCGSEKTYSEVFGDKVVELAANNPKVVAISAAMPNGTGLDKFSRTYPERFFDVGIAEQHAVTFAAGLASGGALPIFAVYSSFLQRAFDQVVHDVATQNLDVVFGIDRAGLVGEDGETHQGLYDIAFLTSIPNLTLMAPASFSEFEKMLEYAINVHRGPIALRYPRGSGPKTIGDIESFSYGKGDLITQGKDITIIAIGNMVEIALKVSEKLIILGKSAEVINARFIKPLDEQMILDSAKKTGKVITIEDGTIKGGFGSSVLELLNFNNIHVPFKILGFPDKFIEHGSRDILFNKYGLDVESIINEILEELK